MTITTATGHKGYRLPGGDWDWADYPGSRLYTVAELRAEELGDRLEADGPVVACDYGLKFDDGSITVVVEATD